VTEEVAREIRSIANLLSARLGIRGLLNLQLALRDGELRVIEANPRASRTVPFVAKATGVPLVDLACRLMLGRTLAELDLPAEATPTRAWAKEAVFPDDRFPGAADRAAEMRSTGEVMAAGDTPSEAYARALRAAGRSIARAGESAPPSLQELDRSAVAG
jgi:carbamoyl-phosphate synthase large subunit